MIHPGHLLKENGLRASKRRGQNFLAQPASARAIAKSLGAGPGDWVVEIGAGLGALTVPLGELAARVIAVEVDRGVFAVLERVLAKRPELPVEPLLQDALGLDWPGLAARAGRRIWVAGNLPYVISSPLIFNLLENLDAWQGAAFMLQKEMAQRLAAPPGNKQYGRISVLCHTFCRVRAGMSLGPDQFFPRPAVESQVVHLSPRTEPLAPLKDAAGRKLFARVVKAAFSQRRKTLQNSLAGGLGISKEEAGAILERAGIDPKLRAETLTPAQFGRITQALPA